MLGAARDLLRSLYHCNLHSLESYIQPRPARHSTDKLFRRGASKRHESATFASVFAIQFLSVTVFVWYVSCLRPFSVLPTCMRGSTGLKGAGPGAS